MSNLAIIAYKEAMRGDKKAIKETAKFIKKLDTSKKRCSCKKCPCKK